MTPSPHLNHLNSLLWLRNYLRAAVRVDERPSSKTNALIRAMLNSFGASRRGVWSIGTDVIMKERPDEGPKSEVNTMNQLANYPDIPTPKVLRDWVDGNQ
ncbi:uncharacterized protein N7479_008631 [Penicillium vulpinum]|uniref:Uncharacterized protein n=1 Tax=Penicillium vulpinum TaxID=29845 RepID=A0A1V6S1I2_9EURO|nr:uncharacterized protein N7479_008631 [Penicillium vulpinum]KAJ5950218.1 hypothetical protein N7479_008631 [Penicillium vulpinum]OQE07728.1 hypothetical protein PENVUL_c012G07173 [Penicillium vulpinum]